MSDKQNEFQLVLQGDKHDIDAKVLSETINNFDNLIAELNIELKPEYPISLRVQTFKEGSFEILFALFADPNINSTLFSLLSKDNLAIAGNIISTLADLISIKQFLGGEKPKTITKTGHNQTKIENNKGEVKVINSKTGDIIFNNPTINVTINNTFQTIENETNVKGIKFQSLANEKEVLIPKAEFENVIKSDPKLLEKEIAERIEPARTITKENVSLSIFKIVFDEKYKWIFVDAEGQKISATIKDKDFFERVKKNELYFTNGDIIIAKLEISQEYNEIAKTYENRGYTVIEIKDVKHQPTQTKLHS
ncbi:hypothetical protein ACQ33O_13295 [Ferruginibacter sp. SUN002]|uniref:hypothetical protein n=1 Tax=Ferruginibacter sp. SUN002 TaxID=2937789 RepID=UPI003D3664AE